MDWLASNSQLLNTLLNLGMLLVWIAYLHVFLSNYRAQRKATILINLNNGSGLDQHCLITNMSSAAIYIHTLTATLETSAGTVTRAVTEPDGLEEWQEPSDLRLWTRQGPLQAGQVRDMGALRTMIEHVCRQSDQAVQEAQLETVHIEVVAIYGSEDMPVAARRTFDIIRRDDALIVRLRAFKTEQLRSRRERKRIVASLQEQIGGDN